jgi:signal transduction histidine kinase
MEEQKLQNENLNLQVNQLQALANIGVTTCMIAHEINNLLTPLSNYAQLALNNPDDSELAKKAMEKTARNCRRASEVMQAILAVANGETQEKQDIRLLDLVEEVFSCLARDFKKDNIIVKIEIPERLMVWVVPVEVQQILMNLILNARDAMLDSGGVLTVGAQESTDSVEIQVSDTGSGIAPDNLEKIFDPFFSTKKGTKPGANTKGYGLGLAFCKKVIDCYNGSILVESTQGEKTTFIINLPRPD